MAAKNQHGRIYVPRKPLSDQFRGEFLKMFNRGFSKKQISRDLQVAPRTVRKIIRHFQRYVTLSAFFHGGSEPHRVEDDVLLQNEYGYQVQYSNKQSIIASVETASRFHVQIIHCCTLETKTSPKSYKTEIKIPAYPGLARSRFEQLGPVP